MANEYERRMVELVQNHIDLVKAMGAVGPTANVESFGYSARIGSEAAPLTLAGGAQQAIIPIQSDADFILSYISTAVILPATVGDVFSDATASTNVLLQITDTGAGETLFAQPMPAFLASGTPFPGSSGIPLVFPIPRIIPVNTNILIEATFLGPVVAVTNPEPVGFFVSLMGARAGRF